jgi:hypothetical protein
MSLPKAEISIWEKSGNFYFAATLEELIVDNI